MFNLRLSKSFRVHFLKSIVDFEVHFGSLCSYETNLYSFSILSDLNGSYLLKFILPSICVMFPVPLAATQLQTIDLVPCLIVAYCRCSFYSILLLFSSKHTFGHCFQTVSFLSVHSHNASCFENGSCVGVALHIEVGGHMRS